MKKDGYCKECNQFVEATRVEDGPDFCPECRSIDTIDFDYEGEEDDYSRIFGKMLNELKGKK